MEDRAYQNAMKRRQRLQAEIEEIDRFLALWKRYAGTEAEQQESTSPVGIGGTATLNLQPVIVSPGQAPKKTDLPKEKLAPIIRDLLLEKGRPMARSQIVQALAGRGITVGGENPSRNMGTIMWRLREQFTNIESEGYWPIDCACEAVGYYPEKSAD